MAALSEEEENYVRIALLLTGVAPRAVRCKFDREFAPAALHSTISKEYHTLSGLKSKRIINQAQWDILYPRNRIPDSKKFDTTLMICLLRNLVPVAPPINGFDCLPKSGEIHDGADLARIKFYRNYLAHLDDTKIDNSDFTSAWNNVTDAVGRLGNVQMVKECHDLEVKILDKSNKEIMLEIQNSNKEIRDLKHSLEELKRSHECLGEDIKEVKRHKAACSELEASLEEKVKEVSLLKDVLKDSVPWNIRVQMNEKMKSWKGEDEMFVPTRAAKYVLESIKTHSCVTVTGSSGIGKTFTIRHVALHMAGNDYDVIPITTPDEIVNFYNPNIKSLFVIDDLCGTYTLDNIHFNNWKTRSHDIKQILEADMAKIIMSCRLQVYQDIQFKEITLFPTFECNLLSDEICLLPREKQSMVNLYLKEHASEISQFVHLYDFFPLLCKLYYTNPKLNVVDFFKNPFSVYEQEVSSLRTTGGAYGKFCVIVLCVVFNNHLLERLFTCTDNLDQRKQKIFENVCEECKLNKGTSRLVLRDELDSLIGSFLRKRGNFYSFMHQKLFDFLSFYLGKTMTRCLIKNADSKVIAKRFLFEKDDDSDQFLNILQEKHQGMYIQRVIEDWFQEKISDVFSNKNIEKKIFRDMMYKILNNLKESRQNKLASLRNVSYDMNETFYISSKLYGNIYTVATPLFHFCRMGDTNLVKWLCDHGAGINLGNDERKSPLYIACKNGHIEVLSILLDNMADVNQYARGQKSPLYIACKEDQTEIVSILIDKGADVHKCTLAGETSLYMACKGGYTEIVTKLLENGADVHKCRNNGHSPLYLACKSGHTEIVSKLLDKKANVNIDFENGFKSVLYIACERGYTEIVTKLLDNNADLNKCGTCLKTPFYVACEAGHTEIVKLLLKKGADVFKLTQNKKTALFLASERGNQEIVSMLLEKMTNVNERTKYRRTPLYTACAYGHLEIVRSLLNRNAHMHPKNDHKTPLYAACEGGYTEIVSFLLDMKADINISTTSGKSPLLVACEFGHTDIVTKLLDNNADINTSTSDGMEPLYMACTGGYLEIVSNLLDRNPDINKLTDSGKTPLFAACKGGYTEIVALLLNNNVDINKAKNNGESPIYIACKNGKTETVSMLLNKNAIVNDATNVEASPLYVACLKGHFEIVSALLNNNTNINKCTGGKTAFLIACAKGYTDIVAKLLDEGEDLSKCSDLIISPLFVACKRGHLDVVTLLLDNNPTINSCTQEGESPLYIACANGHFEIMNDLLDHGAEVNYIKQRSPLRVALEKGHTQIVRKLLDNIPNINECIVDGNTPLHIACERLSSSLWDLNDSAGRSIPNSFYQKPHYIKDDDDDYTDSDTDIQSRGSSYADDHNHDYIECEISSDDDDDNIYDDDDDDDDEENVKNYDVTHSLMLKYKDIVQLLVQKGADYTKINNEGKTPLVYFDKETVDLIKSWKQ